MSDLTTLRPRSGRSRLRAVAEFDCFPEFSARVRRLVAHPLGVLLLAAVASLLCGLFLHSQGYVLCGGVTVVVALGVLWPWLSLRGLTGTVTFDRTRAAEGEAVGVRLTLRNRLPWAALGLAVKGGFGGGAEPVAGIASAPRRRTAVCRWAVTPPRRGVYPLGLPRLAAGFPFGLWENSRELAVEVRVVLRPGPHDLEPPVPAVLVGGDQHVDERVGRLRHVLAAQAGAVHLDHVTHGGIVAAAPGGGASRPPSRPVTSGRPT